MLDEKKFAIALVNKGITKQQLAKELGISREALRRRVRNKSFTLSDVIALRAIFGKETADGFLFE